MSNFTSINPSQFTQLLNALNNGGGGGGGSYTLPIATDSVLGGVKVGNGLSIESDGKLNVNASVPSEVQYSTIERKIGTWVDGAALYEKTLVGSIELKGYNRASIGNISNLLPNSNIKFYDCTMSSDAGIINANRADVFIALDEGGDLRISQNYTSATKTWTYNIRFRYTKN